MERLKSIKGIYHQDVGTENRVMICYETEMEAQRAITEIKSSNRKITQTEKGF